jgi:hypothetical protein
MPMPNEVARLRLESDKNREELGHYKKSISDIEATGRRILEERLFQIEEAATQIIGMQLVDRVRKLETQGQDTFIRTVKLSDQVTALAVGADGGNKPKKMVGPERDSPLAEKMEGVPNTTIPNLTDPVVVLALTCWGEARGDGVVGMRAVASVVLNRVKKARWWGTTIISVCLCPEQFSCWNHNIPGQADDPNYTKMMNVSFDNFSYTVALGVAYIATKGLLEDSAGGADSYYDESITPPAWTEPPAKYTCTIGSQLFYITAT